MGGVIVGALSRYYLNNEVSPLLKSALIVGFCGGFTTFSAFSLETVGLLSGGAVGKALLYVTLSVVLCLAGTAIGFFALPRETLIRATAAASAASPGNSAPRTR
jgi:fluoride exporter